MMVRFYRGEVHPKGFFSATHGYRNWDFLNSEYQVNSIHYLRGWNRARIDFKGGFECKESTGSIAKRYSELPSVNLVYLDTFDECKFTYQIVIAFDKKTMSREDVKAYREWESLNYLYNVMSIGHELGKERKHLQILQYKLSLIHI